jgi:hypothetical protein
MLMIRSQLTSMVIPVCPLRLDADVVSCIEMPLYIRDGANAFAVVSYDRPSEASRSFGQVQRTCWWVIGLPGGSSPRPPFSRFARRAVEGRATSLLCSSFFGVWTAPKDLLVGHRTSWGILPQTPVFSLRSARSQG